MPTWKRNFSCLTGLEGIQCLPFCHELSLEVGQHLKAGLHTILVPEHIIHLEHDFGKVKLLLFCPISLRNIFVTKSIKSDKFFSICWGGRRLIRSRAQSSCCSVILLKDTFLCNVWIICNFFYFTILQLHPVVDFM